MGYLTPDSVPSDTICRVLYIPNNEEFLANVTGALQVLTFPESWTPQGLLTPEQSAAALVDMFDQFCFAQGECRVISEIICLARATSPDPKWLACDGTSVLIADYPDLYMAIGLVYTAIPDGTHFNLPNLNDRVGVGAGSAYTLGQQFGEATHTLTLGETPFHTHTDSGHTHGESTALPNATTIGAGAPQPTAVPGVGSTGIGTAFLDTVGGGLAHDNIQPSLALNYFIVALP